MSQLVSNKIMQICIANGIKFTPERIKIQTEYMTELYSETAIVAALNELARETEFFPGVAKVTAKIKEMSGVGDDKSIATEEAVRILGIIKDEGYKGPGIKKLIGERLYNAIGGQLGIDAFGFDVNANERVFIAQLRDLITPIVAAPIRKRKLQEAGALICNHDPAHTLRYVKKTNNVNNTIELKED